MSAAPSEIAWPCPADTVPLRELWRWDRAGVRRLLVLEHAGWQRRDLRAVLLRRTAQRMVAMFRRHPNATSGRHDEEGEPSAWREWLATDRRPLIETGRPLHVVHYVSALHAGGAERQLCNLAAGSARRGVRVSVWTALPPEGEHGHYAALFHDAEITVRTVRLRPLSAAAQRDIPWHLLRHVPEELRDQTAALMVVLAVDRPDVLHCWLDQPNIVGAMAGLLAGVPAIILATRNGNPTNFPRLHFPYQRTWYQLAAASPRVHFLANSYGGAASYAEWIGMPVSRFDIVSNGFIPTQFPTPTAVARHAARARFGLAATDRVICGVFRLADEKRPFVFLDVVRRVRSVVPDLRVLLAGDGERAATVAEVIASTGLSGIVRLLGRRADVGNVLLASDVCLLTSVMEGCPNIALEAQHLGVPIVATAGGGTVDTIAHGETGFLAEVDDTDALADHVSRLLTDDELRNRLALAGPTFVNSRFECERMVEETMAVYRRALAEE